MWKGADGGASSRPCSDISVHKLTISNADITLLAQRRKSRPIVSKSAARQR
jgi:hypothetical protein